MATDEEDVNEADSDLFDQEVCYVLCTVILAMINIDLYQYMSPQVRFPKLMLSMIFSISCYFNGK